MSDDIDHASIGRLTYKLLYLLQNDDEKEAKEKNFSREPIKIYVNSHGGSVYDMWAVIDVIRNSKTPIHTYCTGYAMSAACNIFLAGHKRFMSKHATLLYHQMSCRRAGKYQDLVEDRKEMDYLQNTLEKYILERTKITEKELQRIRENKIDFYVHADKAIELGFTDEII